MQNFFDYRIYTTLLSFIVAIGMSLTALSNHMKILKLEDELLAVYSDKFMLETELLEISRINLEKVKLK